MLQNKLLIIVFLKLIRCFLPQIICGNSDIDCNTLMNVGIIEINLFPCRIDDIRFSSIGVSLMYFLAFCLIGCFFG